MERAEVLYIKNYTWNEHHAKKIHQTNHNYVDKFQQVFSCDSIQKTSSKINFFKCFLHFKPTLTESGKKWLCLLRGLAVSPSSPGSVSFEPWQCLLRVLAVSSSGPLAMSPSGPLTMSPSGPGSVFFGPWQYLIIAVSQSGPGSPLGSDSV